MHLFKFNHVVFNKYGSDMEGFLDSWVGRVDVGILVLVSCMRTD
jgi:hypothetical protein